MHAAIDCFSNILPCPVVSGCATASSPWNVPFGILDYNDTFYITEYTLNRAALCGIGAAGAIPSCSFTANGFTMSGPLDFTAIGSFMYISNGPTNSIIRCNITSGGVLSGCATAISGLAGSPYGKTSGAGGLHRVGPRGFQCLRRFSTPCGGPWTGMETSGSWLYVAINSASQIVKCTVDMVSGALTSCNATGNGAINPYSIAFYANTYAYFPNTGGVSKIMKCNVNAADGTLSNCVDSGYAQGTDIYFMVGNNH